MSLPPIFGKDIFFLYMDLLLKPKNILLFLTCLFGQTALLAQAFGKHEHEALLGLQRWVNEATLSVYVGKFDAELAYKLQMLNFVPCIAHLKQSAQTLLATAKASKTKAFRTQQIALMNNIYAAYLKANELERLENDYHHAEAEMTNALYDVQQTLHTCNGEGRQVLSQVIQVSASPLPLPAGKAHEDFWEAWRIYHATFVNAEQMKRLAYYNQTLVPLFNHFIDLASQKAVYMPYQHFLLPCEVEEAGAEGK